MAKAKKLKLDIEPELVAQAAALLAAMEEAERDADMYGPFDSVEEMMKSLNS